MAEMILPVAALVGLAQAAPQGLGLGAGVAASATIGAGLGLGGAPAVPTTAIPSITLPTLPITTSATQVNVPVPVVGGGGLPALPSLPVGGGLPSLPVGGGALPNPGGLIQSVTQGLPALPTGLPAVGGGLPAVPSILPLPVEAPSLAIPAILQTALPTGSVLPVEIKTLVPLANTDIIATLASLPANAIATDAISSALAALPTDGLPTLPELPTGVLPGGLPELTAAPDVSALLESITSDALADIISAVASALAAVASAAGGALPTPVPGLPTEVLSALEAIPTAELTGALPTGVPGVPNVTLPLRQKEGSGEAENVEAKEKRQLPGLGNIGNLLGGGSSPVAGVTGLVGGLLGGAGGSGGPLAGIQNAVGGLLGGAGLGNVVGGLTAGNALVGNIANTVNGLAGGATPLAFLNPLLGSTGGLGGLSAVLAGTPLGGIIETVTGIPSIVLSTVKDIPIVGDLATMALGVKAAAIAPLTDILSGLPILGGLVANAISTMNTFGLYNVDPFTQLVPLTNVAALQTAVQFINPKDLALASYIMGSQGNALGSLLSDPTALIKAISAAAPIADNLPSVASFMILSDLGATGIQNIIPGIDASAVQNLISKLPVGSLPVVGGLTSALPVKE